MWLSMLNDLEEEMEYRRDDVYQQIFLLVKQPARYLSASTKRALRNHFANFNFGYDWVEDGEELLQKAKTERMIKAENKLVPHFYTDDNQDTDKVSHLAEYWENVLTNKNAINQLNKYGGWYTDLRPDWCRGHRGGIKRDKFALWASRHQRPTRHQLIKLGRRLVAQI